jgi:ribosomal-protein-alanine N-acetyltransferase
MLTQLKLMMENLLIEKFEPLNLNEILEIEKNVFEKKEVFPKEYFLELSKKWPEGFWVAKIDKEVVGYAMGEKNKNSGLIISIAVKKEWRGKGVGRKLIEKLLEIFQREGVKVVFLHVREGNKEAINFYQTFEFKIRELVENYYSNGESAYLMEKRLGE